MVFVIDNSGSMGGDSMEEAKASLEHALRTLRPQDHFNVIRFDDTMTQLFEHSVPASREQVETAVRFARSLEATGGTEMLPALKAALKDAAATGGPGMTRQIIFLTDGDISNEEEMAAAIAADGGKSHVFPVGIGSAPNNYLMARMAAMGGGTYTNIGNASEVTTKMTALLDALSRPALQDVRVTVSGGSLQLTPKQLPDVYAGQSLVLLGRTEQLKGSMTVSGRLAGKSWSETIDLGRAIDSPAVTKLWARRRIDEVETDRTLQVIDDEAADKAIEELGMDHGIVTKRTSLVAVDETPARAKDQPLTREEVPINLPAGWNWDDLLGGDAARTALANAAAQADAAAMEMAEAVELPETAIGFMKPLKEGFALIFLGALGLFLSRRRRGRA
jgi:Ca-activated chloride channel family protein